MREITFLLILSLLFVGPAFAQAPGGTINGIVLDPLGGAIAGAQVVIVNDATGVQYVTKTNEEGIYVVSNLPPGPYRIQVSNSGFKTIIKPDIVIHVQDALAINFTLPIGAASEVVTVQGGTLQVNTESAAVSTVVDRQFAENLPMNGRSFQTLIQLTPGVVLTVSNNQDSGQFSVNGQRAASNYWMVDGVSANIGVGSGIAGNGLGGTLGSFSAFGGTNSLVSVDAMQEFRIQTSSYAPEFGRTPGGQISIVTRSGTGRLHGTLFDFFRNDVLDANNWFANSKGLAKPRERQNDFGGTFHGPVLKDRTFFFFSYEGLRLRLPQTTLTTVPDIAARQNAIPTLQPYLNAFPSPNGPDNSATGIAQFNASYSNPATLNAYSLRIDHKLNKGWSVFGRYNYSPSQVAERGGANSLNTVSTSRISTQTATVGVTWFIAPARTNDLRFNYSRVSAGSRLGLDNFGAAVPLASLPFPSPFTSENASFILDIFSLQQGSLASGRNEQNLQRQLNIVDSFSVQKSSHLLKFGADFRALLPKIDPFGYTQQPFFANVSSAEQGNLLFAVIASNLRSRFLFRNLGSYAQDTWHWISRLTLTYGLRWDVDFVPSSLEGSGFPALTGFDLANLSNLALAPTGTPPFKTAYGNLAPRLGVAYQLFQNQDWQTVLRGGVGLFYDLASSEMGNQVGGSSYPFGALGFAVGGTFPLSPAAAAPPPITPPTAGKPGRLFALDPRLKLPYTLEWNVALEQGLGRQQTISVSYVGSAGRRLLQTANVLAPSPEFSVAFLVTNAASSDYDALQLQFQRRLSLGLQALASYSWAHSIDTGSAGSSFFAANAFVPAAITANRGPSDFDIRSGFSAGVSYDVPSPRINKFLNAVLSSWSLQNVIQARTAPPVDVSDARFFAFNGGTEADIRPDLVPGQPLYLFGSQFPGGKAFNPAAFQDPPVDPSTGNVARQGSTPRNFLRGFGATEWDFAIHRDFLIHEALTLQFRAEIFNVVNHPNFGPPKGAFGLGGFGLSSQTLAQSLNFQNLGGGAFNPLYQVGGPRSVQLALKLAF